MSKIQDLKAKHPEFIVDIIGDLSKRDPSGTNKYLPFMVESSVERVVQYFGSLEYIDDVYSQLFTLVNNFEKYCKLNLIENKDIYSYNTLEEIDSVVKEAKANNTNREIKEMETLVLYEDKDKILVKCLSMASSNLYGRNTEWCTSSAKSKNRFSEYAGEGVLLYFIFKPNNPPAGMPPEWRKLAINRQNLSSEKKVWNAKDKEVSTFDAMRLFAYIGQEPLMIIANECDLCIPNAMLKKTEKGTVEINESLFQIEGFSTKKKEITEYILTLQDQRVNNTKLIPSYEPSLEKLDEVGEESGIDDIVENLDESGITENTPPTLNSKPPTGVAMNGFAIPTKPENEIEVPLKIELTEMGYTKVTAVHPIKYAGEDELT